jgi:hypothetical protein
MCGTEGDLLLVLYGKIKEILNVDIKTGQQEIKLKNACI